MNTKETGIDRRGFLLAGSVGSAMALALGDSAFAADTGQSAAEKANEKIVNDFCATWESMDVDKLAGFLADEVVFRMIDTAPFVEGKEALREGIVGFLATRNSARFEVLRSHAVGNVVVNERVDHFGREEGNDAFHVTGVFLVKNGKIAEWRDYMVPGPAAH